MSRLDPDVQSAVDAAVCVLATAGLRIEETQIPDAVEAGELAHLLILADAAALYGHILRTRPAPGRGCAAPNRRGSLCRGGRLHQRTTLSGGLSANARSSVRQCRALVLPATPTPAPRLGEDGVQIGGLWEDVDKLRRASCASSTTRVPPSLLFHADRRQRVCRSVCRSSPRRATNSLRSASAISTSGCPPGARGARGVNEGGLYPSSRKTAGSA